jgi:hypothetical protein
MEGEKNHKAERQPRLENINTTDLPDKPDPLQDLGQIPVR